METWATNKEQARYWNSDEAAHWLVHEQRYTRMLAPFTDRVLTTAGIRRMDRVVDIGCGTGSTTRAAGRVAVGGKALGVDLSAAMLQYAARRAHAEGLSNIRFEHGDAQVHRFAPGANDVAMSRFGVMFFDDPVAAFTNIARALRRGGRLAFVCWQNAADNEWIAVPGAAIAQHVALAPLGNPAAPGPFSLSEPDRIATLLRAAALIDIGIESIAEPLWIGADVVDALTFLTSTAMWKSLLRDADPLTLTRARDAVAATLEPYVTADGLLLGSRAWLVTADKR